MTSGRASERAREAASTIESKLRLLNEGTLRSGARTRKPSGAKRRERISAFRPFGEEARPCR